MKPQIRGPLRHAKRDGRPALPDGHFRAANMERYREESRLVMQIVGRSGGAVEQVSVDEAYLDLSALARNHRR